MSEIAEALLLANKLLDEPNADPDSDLMILSRHLIRKTDQLRSTISLLKVAKCPACDGSGAYYQGSNEEPEVVQCQWCDERSTFLAATPSLLGEKETN